jgi:hypothetical protein
MNSILTRVPSKIQFGRFLSNSKTSISSSEINTAKRTDPNLEMTQRLSEEFDSPEFPAELAESHCLMKFKEADSGSRITAFEKRFNNAIKSL